jgi:hypothetical protein
MIAGCVLTLAGTALAQQAPAPMRIRGQIDKVEGNALTVKARDGATLAINLPDTVRVTGMVKAALADIKPNSYIGVTAMPQPDGSQKAIAIHYLHRGAARHRRGAPAMGSAAGLDDDQRGGRDDGRECRRTGADREVQSGRQDRGEEGDRAAGCRDRRLSAGGQE